MLAAGSGNAMFKKPIAGSVGNQVPGVIKKVWRDTSFGQYFVWINSETLQNRENFHSAADAERRWSRLLLAGPTTHFYYIFTVLVCE